MRTTASKIIVAEGWHKDPDGEWRHHRYPAGRNVQHPDVDITYTPTLSAPRSGVRLEYDPVANGARLIAADFTVELSFGQLGFLLGQMIAVIKLCVADPDYYGGATLTVSDSKFEITMEALQKLFLSGSEANKMCQSVNALLWREKARLITDDPDIDRWYDGDGRTINADGTPFMHTRR